MPGDGAVTVELLDPTFGRPVKAWTFGEQERITIGREEGQDVELNDGYVSRKHAELVRRNGQWVLVSLGRNGVLVGQETIQEQPVRGETIFRLGSQGPALRLKLSRGEAECLTTFSPESLPVPCFQIDGVKLHSDVSEIAEGEYFQALQQQAHRLRRTRGGG